MKSCAKPQYRRTLHFLLQAAVFAGLLAGGGAMTGASATPPAGAGTSGGGPSGAASAVSSAGTGATTGAGQVTLPLAQYEELRTRSRLMPAPPAEPPAPFTIAADELAIVVGPASAAVVQQLTVRVLSTDWVTIPVGEAGSLVSADLGGLEGRVDSAGGGSILRVRGAGEHRLRLESAVVVAGDDTATRPVWRFTLRLPAAAVIGGRLAISPALAGKVEEAAVEAGGLLQAAGPSGPSASSASSASSVGAAAAVGAGWTLAGESGQELRAALYGRAVLPERARLPLRFEATSAVAVTVVRTRLRARAWVDAHVAQGRLAELRLRVPAGLTVEGATGQQVAGWKVADGVLTVTPFAPAEDQLAVAVDLSAAAADSVAAPLLVPEGAVRTIYLARAALQGDGLLELADPGSTRPADAAEAALLAPAGAVLNVSGGAGGARSAGTAGSGGESRGGAAVPFGKLYLVGDAARPPRWQAQWAERTEVLAAQVDHLWVEVAAGEAGRATYQVWAQVRNRGSADLTLTMPPGFELQLASRDGVPMALGVTPEHALTVALLARDAPQLVHLSGLVALALPARKGDLAVPLPGLSAPAARVEVRLLLPGAGRGYTLVDPTRAAGATLPPLPQPLRGAVPGNDAPAAGRGPGDADLAAQLRLQSTATASFDGARPVRVPPGFLELTAAWSALSANPAPLAVSVSVRKEDEPWF